MRITLLFHTQILQNIKQSMNHTQGEALNLLGYLPLEEGNCTWYDFLFIICVFAYHVEILAVG